MDKLRKAAALMGKKGGAAKVPKGFAKMPKKKLKAMAKAAARKRWNAA